MNIQEFNFPKMDGVSIAFSTLRTDKTLLEEAKERGFYNGQTPYNKLFSTIFFSGGQVKFKSGLEKSFVDKAWPYTRALMSSWEPKHEEKEAICAMLLSELVEPEIVKS